MMTASRPMHGDNWTMMSCGPCTELQCWELSSFVVGCAECGRRLRQLRSRRDIAGWVEKRVRRSQGKFAPPSAASNRTMYARPRSTEKLRKA